MALTMVKPEEMEAQAGTKLPPGEWFEVDFSNHKKRKPKEIHEQALNKCQAYELLSYQQDVVNQV